MRVLARGIALGVAGLALAFVGSIYLIQAPRFTAFLFSSAIIVSAVALFIGMLVSWAWKYLRPSSDDTSPLVPPGIDAAIRWALALGLLGYALAKFNMNQFPPPFPWTQDMALGNLTPFRLAWAFFGTSQGYVRFIGVGELLAAGLLLHRRTAFVGSIIAGGLLLNIAAIDFFYGAPAVLPLVGALGACALVTLIVRNQQVRALFQPAALPRPVNARIPLVAYAAYGAGIVAALAIARSEYRFAQRRGTASPLGGRWEIIGCEPPGALAFCVPGMDTSRARLYLNHWFGNGRMRVGGFPEPFSASAGNRAYSHFLTYAQDERSDSVRLTLFPVPPRTGDTVRLLGKAAPHDSIMLLTVGDGSSMVRLRRVRD